jgi:DNA-binding SARP family transcriptional activator
MPAILDLLGSPNRYESGRLATVGDVVLRNRVTVRAAGTHPAAMYGGRTVMSAHLQLFGAPRVLRDGQPLTFDTRKAVALLAYLAVAGTPQRRESLAALLWPEAEASRARATLRRTLSVAASVGPSLRMEGPEVWLEGASCDVVAFERALAAGAVADLERAAELAQAPFLAGFALRDSPAFDEWQAMTADRLRDALAAALGELTAAMAERGQLAAALGHARARIALDPLNEPAQRDLMRALAQTGDRPGALRQYRSLIRLLDRELGVPPLPETAELVAAIRRGEAPTWPGAPDGAPFTRPTRAAATQSTLVGRTAAPVLLDRDAVVRDVLAAWQASTGAATVVGVTGEAGIGRTALLASIAERVASEGARVLSVRGRESERHLGLAALADLLDPVLALAPDQRVRDALAGLGAGTVPGPDPGSERRRVAAIVSLLEAARAGAPTLVVVDDAHLLDPSSAQEIAYLLRRLPAGVCALVAWPSDRAGTGLPRAVRELDGARMLRLNGLGVEAVRQLAGDRDAPDLWERTRGVPRLVLECLASADADAADDLRAMVLARLDRLSPEAMQVLAAAAVLAGPASPDLLRTVSGRDERGTVEAIEEALALSLLIEVGADYDLPHATARDLVTERTTRARQALLHRRAADHLAAHAMARAVHPGVVARHYSDAGLAEAAAPWHERAAERSVQMRAHTEALAHLALAGTSGTVDAARGQVLVRLGRYDEAVVVLEAALAAGDLDPSAAAATLHRLADVHDRLGEWHAAQDLLASAEATLDPSIGGPLLARLRVDRALSSYRLGDLPEARAVAEQVAREEPGADEQARAWNVVGLVAMAAGDTDEALRAFTRSAGAAGEAGAGEVSVAAWHNQSRALHLLGRLDEAYQAAEHARALAEQEADVHRIATVESHLADLLHAQGRGEEARSLQTRSAQALAGVALPQQRPEVWLVSDW